MIEETPTWRYTSPNQLHGEWGHVDIFGDYVVGEWFCLKRQSGERLWDKELYRANSLVAVSNGIILATYKTVGGPSSGTRYGCYGYSLNTGEFAWLPHQKGTVPRRGLARVLEFIPGLTTEFTDTPWKVDGREITCYSGRIIDIATGEVIRTEPEPNIPWESYSGPPIFKYTWTTGKKVPVPDTEDLFITMKKPGSTEDEMVEWQRSWDFGIYCVSSAGNLKWQFRISSLGLYSHSDTALRYEHPYVYILAAETDPEPAEDEYALARYAVPAHYRLLLLDARSGEICQNFRVTNDEVQSCRFETITDDWLLLSCENQHLSGYRLANTTASSATQ